MDLLYAPRGWSAVPDPSSAPEPLNKQQDEAAEEASALPPEVIHAFLQSHQQQGGAHALASIDTVDEDCCPAFSSASSSAAAPLPNPFAPASGQQQQKQPPPAAPDIATRLGGVANQQQQKRQRGLADAPRKRSVLRRLVRALAVAGASAGLLAAGAWGGYAAYSHYMAQLDDREQLARRVAELGKAEERLLLRCTALEQDRAGLQQRVSRLSAAAAEGDAERGKLRQRLGQVEGDREEALRHNLRLQTKLTALEEAHAALSAAHKEGQQALDASRAEAGRLAKEAGQLAAAVEKLESRCSDLGAAQAELRRENGALAAEAAQRRQAAARA